MLFMSAHEDERTRIQCYSCLLMKTKGRESSVIHVCSGKRKDESPVLFIAVLEDDPTSSNVHLLHLFLKRIVADPAVHGVPVLRGGREFSARQRVTGLNGSRAHHRAKPASVPVPN